MEKKDVKKGILNLGKKFIFLLVIVAIITVGATFARYTTSQTGSATSTISYFGCSYTIDEISSYAFTNATWPTPQSGESGFNTPQSIKFTANNYTTDDSGAKTVTDVDVQSVFRFTLPYALLSDIAIQLVQVDGSGVETAITPQYDIPALIADLSGSYDTSDTNYKKITNGITERTLTISKSTDTGGNLTSLSATYTDSITYSGGTTEDFTTTVELTKTSAVDNVKFGYTRSRTEDYTADTSKEFYAPELMVECSTADSSLQTLMTEWYIDITVPSMYLETGDEQSATFMFYFTPLTKQDYDASYDYTSNAMYYGGSTNVSNHAGSIQLAVGSAAYTFSNLTVESISFNVNDVNIYSSADCNDASPSTATVRVVRSGSTGSFTYDYYYYDSDSQSYTAFTLSSGDVYSATVTKTDGSITTTNTYYINTAEAVNAGTSYTYTDSSCTTGETAATVKVIKTSSGYDYYVYDSSAESFVQFTLYSGNVYSGTINGGTVYINLDEANLAAIISGCTANINDPTRSYDGMAVYSIYDTADGSSEVASIYYNTYAQVYFVQMSESS
ncbi:MAG: hypothetical protein LUD27_04570 [Clostridia bacterium]|nr:hypothetical protein [Clostridia bacterium]